MTTEKSDTPLYDLNRSVRQLEPHYCRHVSAMTAEGLHSKSDIAAELAFRDQRIESLERKFAESAQAPMAGEDLDDSWKALYEREVQAHAVTETERESLSAQAPALLARLGRINDLIYAKGAPLGSQEYFEIRELAADKAQAPVAGEVAEVVQRLRHNVALMQAPEVNPKVRALLSAAAKTESEAADLLASLSAQIEALKRERDAIQELLSVHNLGGMTDYTDGPMKRALAAEQRADRLQEQIEALKRERDSFKHQLAAERAHSKAQERIATEARSNADRLQAELDAWEQCWKAINEMEGGTLRADNKPLAVTAVYALLSKAARAKESGNG